ncbi:diguanylate cyclase [Alishewanella sp. d11]|uniref:GGDEF domain-containing protein n=1 Tax=Alishewanella sp. d11 TaxID=3414030 RepID=UPI003BF8CA12
MDILTLNIINLMLGMFAAAILIASLKHFCYHPFLKFWCCAAIALTLNASLGMLLYFGINLAYWLVPGISNTATIAIHLFIFTGLLAFFSIRHPAELFTYSETNTLAQQLKPTARISKLEIACVSLFLATSFVLAFTPFAQVDIVNRLIIYFPIILLLNGLSLLLIARNIGKHTALKGVLHAFAMGLTFNIVQISVRLLTFVSEKLDWPIVTWLQTNTIYEIGFFSLAIFSTLIFSSSVFLLHKLKHLNLVQMLEHDPLTGVLNRRSMESKLSRALSRCAQEKNQCSILLFDIDNFKQLNDTYGHLVGDCVLQHVANTIQDSLRPADMLFRFGGEEFLLCLPNASSAEALKIAERLRQHVAHSAPAKHPELFVTISVGLATETSAATPDLTQHTSTIQTLVEQADAALYQAKRTGRNKTVLAKISY